MASTGKTPNLGLCQWQLSDPFLMEDMNEDNRKVDAAVAAVPYVKLMDVTTSADAAQVDLDVSSIDFTKFACISIYAFAPVRGTDGAAPSGTSLWMRIDNQNGCIGGNTYSYVAEAPQQAGWSSAMRVNVLGFQEQPAASYTADGKTYYYQGLTVQCAAATGGGAGGEVMACRIGTLVTGFSTTQKFNFLARGGTSDQTYKIKAGSKFLIYGVKI